ncbi:hypothetical protein NE865_15049 [Phthorimaea operculella]|nr:hypothetical protein NE865_15049 [Phthorimaea operculella]
MHDNCKPQRVQVPACRSANLPSNYKLPKGLLTMGCFLSLIKNTIVFGAGVYTGVYIAQNYQASRGNPLKSLVAGGLAGKMSQSIGNGQQRPLVIATQNLALTKTIPVDGALPRVSGQDTLEKIRGLGVSRCSPDSRGVIWATSRYGFTPR